MCKPYPGKRCDEKWTTAHKERYNARRRVARNTAKAQKAGAAGDEEALDKYVRLVMSAESEVERLDKVIKEHEESSAAEDTQSEGTRHPLASQSGEPLTFDFVRNPVSSTEHVSGNEFGQDIEPSGRYMSKSSGFVPEGWESGTVDFKNPLYLEFGGDGSYEDPDNWKARLTAHYGKTGTELSKAIYADGHDAIITHDRHGMSEVVDLTHLKDEDEHPVIPPVETPVGTGTESSQVTFPSSTREAEKSLKEKYGIELRLRGDGVDDYVTLSKIVIPDEQRGTGIGSKAMQEICDIADHNGWDVDLTPSADYGGSVKRLKEFYQRFGFVPNKGKNKDFLSSQDFIRKAK